MGNFVTTHRPVRSLRTAAAASAAIVALVSLSFADDGRFSTNLHNKAHSNAAASQATPSAAEKDRILTAFGKLPLTFEANRGQTDSRVRFLSRGGSYDLFLTATEAVWSIRKSGGTQGSHASMGSATVNATQDNAAVRMSFSGANPTPRISGVQELPGTSNYFIGNDFRKWTTKVPLYAKVRYDNLYPCVDLLYYGNEGQLEYDFVLAPGADPKSIQFNIEGTEKFRVDGNGDLRLEAQVGPLVTPAPVWRWTPPAMLILLAIRILLTSRTRPGYFRQATRVTLMHSSPS